MKMVGWFHPVGDEFSNGVKLAVLNGLLATVCIFSYASVSTFSAGASHVMQRIENDPTISVHFPLPVLLVAYVTLFLVAWVSFARRVPDRAEGSKLESALVGALPFALVSVLGYAAAAILSFFPGTHGSGPLDAGPFVYAASATLMLLAGSACACITLFMQPRPATPARSRWSSPDFSSRLHRS